MGYAEFSLQWLLLLRRMGSRVCGIQQLHFLGSEAQLNNCGTWPHSIWGLPRPEIALAGRFLTAELPGKPPKDLFRSLNIFSIPAALIPTLPCCVQTPPCDGRGTWMRLSFLPVSQGRQDSALYQCGILNVMGFCPFASSRVFLISEQPTRACFPLLLLLQATFALKQERETHKRVFYSSSQCQPITTVH